MPEEEKLDAGLYYDFWDAVPKCMQPATMGQQQVRLAAWRRTLWIDMDSIKIHILEFKRKHRISRERNSKS